MPNFPLYFLLIAAGVQFIGGVMLVVLGGHLEQPWFARSSAWGRLVPVWGAVLAVEGVGQCLYWVWSWDLDGDGPPAGPLALLTALALIVLLPLAYGTWRTWVEAKGRRSRPAA